MCSPFHKIQRWNGRHYRTAELWEVGCYILVQHRAGGGICRRLRLQIELLEESEIGKDQADQSNMGSASEEQDIPMRNDGDDENTDVVMDDTEDAQNAAMDEFIAQLYARHEAGLDVRDDENPEELEEDEPDGDNSNMDNESQPIYRYTPGCRASIPNVDALQNPYVRVVHTNGMHHLALVSCPCDDTGSDGVLAYDLVGARLIPTSFNRIQTLFTGQLLDYFRLSNLELKASAYQFYQLLRRITMPNSPAEVINLYNEFRRMSRLWRWMKRLKWNGFGHNGRNPIKDIVPGELANFCPTCPQPGINIPDDWKKEADTFLYKRIFVADGNFKADHVRQKNSTGGVWLSEGGGMDPDGFQYSQFLKTAKEKPTVCRIILGRTESHSLPRRPLVKTLSERFKMHCLHHRLAI